MAKASLYVCREPYRNIWTAASGRLPFFHAINSVWLPAGAKHWQPQREKEIQKHLALKERKRLANGHATQTDSGRRNFIGSLPAAWKQLSQEAVDSQGPSGLGQKPIPIGAPPRWLSCLPALLTSPQPCPASSPRTPGCSPKKYQLCWTYLVNRAISPPFHPGHPPFNTFREKGFDWWWARSDPDSYTKLQNTKRITTAPKGGRTGQAPL